MAASHVQVLYPTIKANAVSAMKPRWWPTHEILGTSTGTGRTMENNKVIPEPEPALAPFTCKFCGAPSWFEPIDQVPPPDYCHESDHGE